MINGQRNVSECNDMLGMPDMTLVHVKPYQWCMAV